MTSMELDEHGRIPEGDWRQRLREQVHHVAHTVAPRLTYRVTTGETARAAAADLVTAGDWQGLCELIGDRIVTGRDLAAVAAGDRRASWRIAVGLLARTTTWSHAVVADHEWGPEWRWYLHRHVTRVSRALTHLETGW